MLHDANGFLIDPRPSAVFVVANNDGGGIFSFLPQARHAADRFERIFGTPHGRSFERLAAFHGVSHRWVDVPVGSLVAEAVAAGGVHILEAVGDRAANVVHHRRIVEAVGTALAD
jgi:2-succinyl-5-enolpyruvyl-6-hydroxy-3-cyclohexene-1-carboxylate synthase